MYNNRIQKFSSNGTFISKWGANGITGKSVALEIQGDVLGEVTPPCTIVSGAVKNENSFAVKDAAYGYADGLWDFEANCSIPGRTITVTLYYYDVIPGNKVLRKHNPNTNAYFTVGDANITTRTINGHEVTVAKYTVKDGSMRDTDGVSNGTIKDPAGLADAVIGAPNTGF